MKNVFDKMVATLIQFQCVNWPRNSTVNTLRQIMYLADCLYSVDGLVQERRNSIANTFELHLSCATLTHVLVQGRHNSIANTLELHLSCTNPSVWQ